ncbi:cell division protein ZapE [Deinococcus deserti]|uniref:Putative ATPase n=1 Tax=Deinococcus deserti (strain DSM 17065 / CIP 109153 / LMG 22923 / VCD115) TaxID=546414 RepID=C1D0E9_DEIDV|nr:cell division protein ZapE [Deinococcus deserti]ACO45323.1 putative ATPase [Deinococcus deserti VCD115]
MIDLLSRMPSVTPDELTAHLTPSPRYDQVRFATYQPNPGYPSQGEARDALEAFVRAPAPKPSGFRLFRRSARPEGQGLYLDGGFGVGKTHLLASAWHAAPGRAALMSFQDLMYIIGTLGMNRAVEAFRNHDLLLIDEFELDDPGNTHMANTFLGQLMPGGTHVVATSNTEPGALGQGRFNARDFERQIQGIANRFVPHTIDGPDYRQRGTRPEDTLQPAEFAAWQARQNPDTLSIVQHRDLNRHLLRVHPSHFPRLLQGIGALGVEGLCPMADQNVALRFVHFIDKLYDLGLNAAFTGAPLGTLFDETYRHGAYAKKYSRCLSRLSEMLREAREGG